MKLLSILLKKRLCENRDKAKLLLMAGKIRINDRAATRLDEKVERVNDVSIVKEKKYVSRGGLKLEHALTAFKVNPKDKICLDIGSSTGGFVDCLLQHGAKKVYAVEVGKGALDWKLRNDPRVVVMEDTNILHLKSLPEKVDLVTIDVSFTPLKKVFPLLQKFSKKNTEIIALVKPHYEAQDPKLLRQGVVKSDRIREKIVEDLTDWLEQNGWEVKGKTESPIKGTGGNVEYLIYVVDFVNNIC